MEFRIWRLSFQNCSKTHPSHSFQNHPISNNQFSNIILNILIFLEVQPAWE
jgi:hypothetical protein